MTLLISREEVIIVYLEPLLSDVHKMRSRSNFVTNEVLIKYFKYTFSSYSSTSRLTAQISYDILDKVEMIIILRHALPSNGNIFDAQFFHK